MNEPEYYSYCRHEIVAAVPSNGTRILSVGCGFGLTEEVLALQGREVWGIERERDAATQARSRLSHVICADAETAFAECPKAHFDCLIMADILEHLADPWSALTQYRSTLREGGTLIVSLPNVRFVGVVIPLILGGRWNYAQSGVLDRTHLRFFTRKTAINLVRDAGFSDIKVWPRIRTSPYFNRAAAFVQRSYYSLPILQSFLAKQFIIRAELHSSM